MRQQQQVRTQDPLRDLLDKLDRELDRGLAWLDDKQPRLQAQQGQEGLGQPGASGSPGASLPSGLYRGRPYSQGGWGSPDQDGAGGPRPASAGARYWAYTVDSISVLILLLVFGMVHPSWALIAGWGLFLANTVVMQGATGLTLGRILSNTRMVKAGTDDPPGIHVTALRCLIFGVLNAVTLSLMVFLNAAWVVKKHQTIPDLWCGVEVIRLP